MENNLIAAKDFCLYHSIEISFIESLNSYGLLETKLLKKSIFIYADDILKIESYLRLYKDLEINFEGLHAVAHLLAQINNLQKENISLKNEINYYKQIS